MPDLRDLLMTLAEIGRPSVRRMRGGGWHADVEFPAPEGVSAEVKSRFDHRSPEEALQCVHDRLGGMRTMLSVPTPAIGATHQEINGD